MKILPPGFKLEIQKLNTDCRETVSPPYYLRSVRVFKQGYLKTSNMAFTTPKI